MYRGLTRALYCVTFPGWTGIVVGLTCMHDGAFCGITTSSSYVFICCVVLTWCVLLRDVTLAFLLLWSFSLSSFVVFIWVLLLYLLLTLVS